MQLVVLSMGIILVLAAFLLVTVQLAGLALALVWLATNSLVHGLIQIARNLSAVGRSRSTGGLSWMEGRG